MAITKTSYPPASVGALTDIDTVARNPLGLRQFGDDGATEYIYLPGVAATVIGSVVMFNLSAAGVYQTTLTVTTIRGMIAFAMAATVAATFGWYQIFGISVGLYNGAAVSGAQLFSATTGKCDDASVAGDELFGATVGATVAGGGLGSVFCMYPHMSGVA